MILLIWSIYILVSGKLQISRTYGVKGRIARFVGIIYLLTGIGIINAVIPVQNPYASAGIQLAIIIAAPLIATLIHDNDFTRDEGRITPRHEIVPEELFKYQNAKKLLVNGLISLGIGYLIIALAAILLGEDKILYRQISLVVALVPILISHIYAFVGSYRACNLLNEPFKRYVLGITAVSIILLPSGPLVTTRLLKPLLKFSRQSS